jgi:glycosyltransferase involved in cell wall biosynthesis
MKIRWIISEKVFLYEGCLFSKRPSVRLRCIEPSIYLSQKGHDISLINLFDWQERINDHNFYKADVYVIGKAFGDFSHLIQYLKQLGKKIIVDVCDNIYEPPEDGLKAIYELILPLANTVIAASPMLAKVLVDRIGDKVIVIPDPVEGEKLSPSFTPDRDSLKLLWFGYPNNLSLLDDFLPQLEKLTNEKSISLSIVTSWNDHFLNIFKDGRKGIHICHVEWSPNNMKEELANCDMVIVPSSLTPARITKTANRIMTSLYAGKYVVASPLPAYLEFSNFISLEQDLIEGIRFSFKNPDIVRQRIANGQLYIEKHYSPRIISQIWETVLIDALDDSSL